ncbi:MAG: DUF6521 family protein [Methylobacter sp.]|uniref:three component ABC system middle component n=1 Tax=Methylobacter sp. TaxID=2051955 RepID=UPI00272F704C|nr:three component ABC system middle component [Methylobacter sp.]MDP1666131.1 DUF6521 family protein [Methylobacter sp.]
MTSLADALYQVKYNPFKYGEYLASFYAHLVGVENNLLVAQLVIPLCSYPVFYYKISNAKFGPRSKSTIWTIFDDRTQLYDLQERLDGFKELTDQSLQYCLINDWIEIDAQKLSISTLPTSETALYIHKSGANLGKLFSHLSVVEIYAFLGVTPR